MHNTFFLSYNMDMCEAVLTCCCRCQKSREVGVFAVRHRGVSCLIQEPEPKPQPDTSRVGTQVSFVKVFSVRF